jgi:gephyrin
MTDTKLKAAILIVSETASQDPSTDKCIPILQDAFAHLGNDQWEVASTEIVPDSVLHIQKSIRTWTDGEDSVNLIVTSGGTGFATKDVTPEVC